MQVTSLDLKLGLVTKSLFEIKVVALSKFNRENQLDQLISLCLKHTLKEEEERYKDNLDHHLSTNNTMLKINNDIIYATNELIKQTRVCHEKHIQILERDSS